MMTGSSYGGYITLAAAIKYGDRIRCALEGFGLSDFVAFLDGTDPHAAATGSRSMAIRPIPRCARS